MRRRLLATLIFLGASGLGQAAATEPGELLSRAEAEESRPAFPEAAGSLEAFARAAPADDTRAVEALARAAILRLRLDQDAEAAQDAAAITRWRRPPRLDLVARVAFAGAQRDADRDEWEQARARLVAGMPALDRRASPEGRAEAHARLGRALANLGRPREAALELRRVLAVALGRDTASWDAAGRDALAEARFFFAEELRAAAERIVLAEYKDARPAAKRLGRTSWLERAGRSEGYVTFVLEPWRARRGRAVLEAERAYLRVFGVDAPTEAAQPSSMESLGPPPSPRWAIAAARRIGDMRSDLAAPMAALRRSWDLPEPGDHPLTFEDLRGVYLDPLDEPVDHKLPAKVAFELCLRLSDDHHIAGDDAGACLGWLSRNYAREYRYLDEFAPHPSRVGPPLRPAPVEQAR